jgi:transposase
MIPAGVQIFIALEPVDMRLGFERLGGLVRERIGYEPRSGALFLFVGKRRETLRILFFDGSGMCVFSKKLDRGNFVLPEAVGDGVTHVEVDDAALESLLDGVEIARAPAPKKPPRRLH